MCKHNENDVRTYDGGPWCTKPCSSRVANNCKQYGTVETASYRGAVEVASYETYSRHRLQVRGLKIRELASRSRPYAASASKWNRRR
jgi:hypothetical protein